jgi:hypothetical protein
MTTTTTQVLAKVYAYTGSTGCPFTAEEGGKSEGARWRVEYSVLSL